MPFADNLRLRGRRHHIQRAFAHHRVQQLPAFIGRKLQQRLVHCGKGNIGGFGGFSVWCFHG